jgi:ABC-2 type transport system ATP-binding protein
LPVQGTVSSSGLVEITLAPADEVPVVHRLTGWALERGVPLQDLRVSRAGLEDAYLALVAETGDAVDVPA